MKTFPILVNALFCLLLCFSSAWGQTDDPWRKWNLLYPEVDIVSILNAEKRYADSVERNPAISQWYGRAAKYRFKATYLDQVRPLNSEVNQSMRATFRLFVGDPAVLDTLVDSEVLMKVGEEPIWMPVQKVILQSMKKDVEKGEQLTLYCFYFNNHIHKKQLFNTFLISEFAQ